MYTSLCLDTLLLDMLPPAYQQFAPVFHLVHHRHVELSHVWLSETWWTVAPQAPLSMGFPRQGYWNGLPFPSPGDPGSNLYLLHWQADSLPLSHLGSPIISFRITSLETSQLLCPYPALYFFIVQYPIDILHGYLISHLWFVFCTSHNSLSIALSKVAPICSRSSRNISWIMNEWRKYLPLLCKWKHWKIEGIR